MSVHYRQHHATAALAAFWTGVACCGQQARPYGVIICNYSVGNENTAGIDSTRWTVPDGNAESDTLKFLLASMRSTMFHMDAWGL